VKLEELLASCTPAAAVLINIDIARYNQLYMEQGATLSRTLLPFIDQVTDYCFLAEEAHFICTRFLASLSTHIRDAELSVGTGFILFAIRLNPRTLSGILTKPKSLLSLREALSSKHYPAPAVAVIALYPDKFMFPDLLQFWEGKSGEIISQSA
jgi:hypothetical protein